jgi:hypothetical protein
MNVKAEFPYGACSLDVFISISILLAGDGCRQSFGWEIFAAFFLK